MVLLFWALTFQTHYSCQVLTNEADLMALPIECFSDIESLLNGNRDAINSEIELLLEQAPDFFPRNDAWGVQVSGDSTPHLIRLSTLIVAFTDHGKEFFGAGLRNRGMPSAEIESFFKVANREAYGEFDDAMIAQHRKAINHLTGAEFEDAFWAYSSDTLDTTWGVKVLNEITPKSRRILLAYAATLPSLKVEEANPIFALRRLSNQKER